MASTNAGQDAGEEPSGRTTTSEAQDTQHQSGDSTVTNRQTAGATASHTTTPSPGAAESSTSSSSDMGSSFSSSSTTVDDKNSTQQSSANTNASASASAPPNTAASASAHKPSATPLSPTQSTSSTSSTSTYPSQTENFNVRVDTSTTVTISGLGITRNMSPPKPTGRPAVRFADWTDVQNNDGTTSQHPVNHGSSSTTYAFTAGDTQQQQQQQQASSESEHTAAAPPPPGPPPNPPATPAAAAPEPDPQPPRACNCDTPGATGQDPAAESTPNNPAASEAHPGNQQQTYHPRVVSHIVPPIGPHAAAAMGHQQQRPIYILSSAPGQAPPQNAAFSGVNSNQPYLWVNPPLVAPSVPPPPQGNTGSWCYPSQSPFWAGASANQTNPPPQFYVAEQGYVAQPTYVATTTQQAPQQTPQVQYYVNGTTGPIVYYTQ